MSCYSCTVKYFAYILLLCSILSSPSLSAYEHVIPEGTTVIAEGQFQNNTGLTSVVIPRSVVSVGKSAFSGCTGLERITWSVSRGLEVDESAFAGCANIVRVDFPNGLPARRISFGSSTPTVYAENFSYNGYRLVYSEIEKKLGAPVKSGKVGQVLMMTPNGTEWVNIPGGYSAAIADSLLLKKGWNLVSLPEEELTGSCKENLLKAHKFYTYDAENQDYVQTTTLLPRNCYWVNAAEECTMQFTRQQ